MEKITQYFKEVYAESKFITWPTRKQTMYFTVAVLIISLFIAYYLGALDFLFSKGLERALLLR